MFLEDASGQRQRGFVETSSRSKALAPNYDWKTVTQATFDPIAGGLDAASSVLLCCPPLILVDPYGARGTSICHLRD